MAAKTRTVYFYDAIEIDKDGKVTEFTDDFWDEVFDLIKSLPEKNREVNVRQRLHFGQIDTIPSPSIEYLYLGKLRDGADWPDFKDKQGNHENLRNLATVRELIEPAFIARVSSTPYIAVLRTSGGPTPTGIAAWLTETLGYIPGDCRIELRPFALHDQIQRLNSAIGASRIHLKVAADGLENTSPNSTLVKAMKKAQEIGDGGVSVDMILSYGNTQPDTHGSEELVRAVKDIIEIENENPDRKVISAAKATLLQPSDEGVVKDKIDFTLDRVTFRTKIGHSVDDPLTPAAALSAMTEAIGKFRTRLPSKTIRSGYEATTPD